MNPNPEIKKSPGRQPRAGTRNVSGGRCSQLNNSTRCTSLQLCEDPEYTPTPEYLLNLAEDFELKATEAALLSEALRIEAALLRLQAQEGGRT